MTNLFQVSMTCSARFKLALTEGSLFQSHLRSCRRKSDCRVYRL